MADQKSRALRYWAGAGGAIVCWLAAFGFLVLLGIQLADGMMEGFLPRMLGLFVFFFLGSVLWIFGQSGRSGG